MEIDITSMFADRDKMFYLSGSAMEHGSNAGSITWNNSMQYAKENPLLSTSEQVQAARDYFREFGAWDDEEIDAWDTDCANAMVCQCIAGDIRELEEYALNDEGEWDWGAVEAAQSGGVASGSIYRGDDGRIYFYMGM